MDSTSNQAVEFATVTLFQQPAHQPVNGALTDDKGRFSLDQVAPGDYILEATFLGYAKRTVAGIRVTADKAVALGTIRLAAGSTVLQEVTVTAQTALIEEKVDRLVYNAEKDVTTRGGDAADVLRRVPLLSVDLDGNVSLRGTSNIRVLINNKPSTILASNVADALKQLPADLIKSVEVITSPSAKYDAEGSGGIINIITKKNTLEGFTLTVDAGAGNRSSNLGLNGSYRRGKAGFSLGGFGRGFYNKAVSILDQTTVANGQTLVTDQDVHSRNRGLFGNYNLGFDYDISEKQSITACLRFGVRNLHKEQEQTTLLFENNLLVDNLLRNVDSRDYSNNVDLNLDYLRTFGPRQEWSISSQYSRSGLTNNYDANRLAVNGEPENRQQNLNFNTNQELTFQTDYQTPVGDRQLIEFGGKGIFRMVNSDYEYLTAADARSPYTPDPGQPAGALNYRQNVGSAYVSYTLTTPGKYAFKFGSRYEYTSITAKTLENGQFNVPDYGNLVPSLNVSKTLDNGLTVKAGYNRRIQRPGLQQLNPNVDNANSQNISIGNPALRPELTNNVELGFSKQIKQTNLNISFFGRQTSNAISQVRLPADTLAGALVTTYQNVGRQRAYGTNVFANVQIAPFWSINGGFDLLYVRLEGQAPAADGTSAAAENSGFTMGGRLMTQIKLGRGWGLQGFAFLRGRQVQLQGTQGSFRGYNLGLKKDLANGKGSIGLAAENFLTARTVIMRTELSAPDFSQISETQLLNRGIKLTFNYRLGKLTTDAPKKKTHSVKNDDLKDGEGGGEQQGGGQAPVAPQRPPAPAPRQ